MFAAGTINADAINLRYPTLWNDGAGFSKLVYSTSETNDEDLFRIYQVTGPPKPSNGSPAETK